MWHTTDGDIVLYKPQNAKTFTETVNFTHTNSIFRVLHLLPNMSDNFSNHPNQRDLQTAVFLFWSSNLPHKSYLGTYERPAFWGGRGHWFWYITQDQVSNFLDKLANFPCPRTKIFRIFFGFQIVLYGGCDGGSCKKNQKSQCFVHFLIFLMVRE